MATSKRRDQAFSHVEVGRKVAGVRQNDFARCVHVQRGGERLIDLERQRISDHDRAGFRTDQSRDAVADMARLGIPARRIPRADQLIAPLGDDDAADALGNAKRQRPERIAVEIDHTVGHMEQRFGVVVNAKLGHENLYRIVRTRQSSGNSSTSSMRLR